MQLSTLRTLFLVLILLVGLLLLLALSNESFSICMQKLGTTILTRTPTNKSNSMTFKTDHSILITPSLENLSERKLVAWITSRCIANSGRQKVVQSPKKNYITIDIYGNCGNCSCEVPKSISLTGVDCRMQIHKEYKFYLAFENSNCDDYVTERFFDTCVTEMVPVVFGGADYESMFPPKSYVNVRDYKNARELSDYLKYLGNNPSKWLEYFEWRKKYWVQTNRFVTGYCDVCDKLWNREIDEEMGDVKRKVYAKIWDWWIYQNYTGHSINKPNLACDKNIGDNNYKSFV